MGLTKRPSASHWFKGNITMKTILVTLELRPSSYPRGPGGYSSLPGNSRLLMYSRDKALRLIPTGIVKNENMATVWTTSAHLMPLLMGFVELSNAPIHWKNRATTTPKKMSRTGILSTDRRVCGGADHRMLHQREILRNIPSPQGTSRTESVGRRDR